MKLTIIIECNQEIPEYEEDITEEFLKSIVERERVMKRDYRAPHILSLLIYVVGKSFVIQLKNYYKNEEIGNDDKRNIKKYPN